MKEMEIHKYMDPNIDCVIFDNHFISEARKMSNDPNLIKKGFGKHNFCQNLTKEKNKSNEEDQQICSNLFSGLRSKIETVRNANLVSKFKRFSKHTTKKVTTFEELYSQTKLAIVLLGISQICYDHNDLFLAIDTNRADYDFLVKVNSLICSRLQSLEPLKKFFLTTGVNFDSEIPISEI